MPNTAGNPFDHAFEMLGHAPDVATDSINSEALELLTQSLTSRAGDRGRMVLLRSPRAGFGKTHLLMRLHQRVAHTHEFIPLEPSKGRYLDASEVLDAVLRRFSRILPAGGGLTVLDLLARRILAVGLEPLVRSGEVPSQDRESALQALQQRPVETFDFHNEEAVTARWAMANFGLLGPRLTSELAERTEAGFRPVAWWVELLFRYSSAPLDQTTRNSSLFETVFGSGNVETDMHEKLVTLLNLTGLVTSPVLVLDEVEGFSSNPEAALQVATFLNALHQSCNKLALIISVNGDVWETAFLPRLPCGLKDRLSDIVIDLRPMTKEEAAQLLEDRAGKHAEKVLETLDLDTGVIYARGLIRDASNAWANLEFGETPTQSHETPVSLEQPAAAPISLISPPLEASEEMVEATEPVPEPVIEPEPPVEEVAAPVTAPIVRDTPAPPRHTEDVISAAAAAAAAEIPDTGAMEDDVFGALGHPGTPVSSQPLATSSPEPSAVPEPEGLAYYGDIPPEPRPFTQAQPSAPQQDEVKEPQSSPFSLAEEPMTPQYTETPSEPLQPPASEVQPQAEVASPFRPAVEPITRASTTQPMQPASPFAIDTEATPVSPFQPVEPTQAFAQPASPSPAVQPTPQHQIPAPEGSTTPQPHSVTSEDQDKVEDLLQQFRDRYGRDE